MYRVSVKQHFDAAHFLRGYGGRCEDLHGHRFEVAATVEADKLNEIGLAYDFTELKRQLGDILKRFDHVCLNDVPPFDDINPSSENIATVVFRDLSAGLAGVRVAQVEVWESPESRAVYIP
jgi:6-pyruvoyltetrahydropterin/6-carboxytetrahydropterin synthase